MKCSKCGTENKEAALFCKECGSKILKKDKISDSEAKSGELGDMDASKKKKCSKCGTENKETALFCKKCGNELSKEKKKTDSEIMLEKRDVESFNWFYPGGDL